MENKTIKAIESRLAPIFKKIESSLGVKSKIALGSTALLAIAIAISSNLQPNDVTASSVAITNIAENSGGTGIVLSSSETLSTILTNSHVCHVVEHGGKVTGKNGQFLVATYKHSQAHDLCLITVDGNLKASTKIANRAPVPFYEPATVSGHPALYPNVITNGHFSGRRTIAVMKGVKPCTQEQANGPAAILCALIGGIPQIVQYDATLVTATIMPGSSGSGVYNGDKDLSAVVFAGSGEIGYGWVVPYESMRNFLDLEARTLEAVRPDNTVDFLGQFGRRDAANENDMIKKLKEACSGENRAKLLETCNLVDEDIVADSNMVWFK